MEWGGVGSGAGVIANSAAWAGGFSVVLFNILVLLPHLWWYRVSLVVLGDYRLLLTANNC